MVFTTYQERSFKSLTISHIPPTIFPSSSIDSSSFRWRSDGTVMELFRIFVGNETGKQLDFIVSCVYYVFKKNNAVLRCRSWKII